MDENPPLLPTNRNALISMFSAILTLLSFCIAIAPIPLTGLVCFPAALVLGLAALGTGLASLRQIRSSGENGRNYALTGAWIGGLSVLASLCAMALNLLWIPVIAALMRQVSK